jgi:hypothetical protein
MLIDDLLGFVLVIVTAAIIIFCIIWLILERLVFKQKMGFYDAYKYFTSNRKGDERTEEPNVGRKTIENERRHTRVSMQTNHYHTTTGANGFLNSSFGTTESFGHDNHQDQFNRRLEKFEEDMNEVKNALRKLSQIESRKNKTFDISGILT